MGAVELKKGKTELKNGSKCGLKKTIAQTRQCDQSRNQKRLKLWLKKLLVIFEELSKSMLVTRVRE